MICRKKTVSMDQLVGAFDMAVKRTVFRKLKELDYQTSYSHRGRYYTLNSVAEFDADGLWSHKSVWFSIHGTLVATVEKWVDAGEMGYVVDELDNRLHVGTKDALRKLVREGRLSRKKVDGRYLYGSAEPAKLRRQVLARRSYKQRTLGVLLPNPDGMPEDLKAAFILFFSLLDEKKRRLYAGLESLKLGHGGDRRIADLLGMGAGTVARGRRELLERDIEAERTRKPGGGRKTIEKKSQK